jgi:predicted lactoylglutathione lyase
VSKQVFINLPVANLPKSIAFFKALGYSHNPQFTDDAGACIVVSDTISVMLLTHARFVTLRPKPSATRARPSRFCSPSVARAVKRWMASSPKRSPRGGSIYDKPEDCGFMYMHSFVDLDGHGWGLLHMSAMPAQG